MGRAIMLCRFGKRKLLNSSLPPALLKSSYPHSATRRLSGRRALRAGFAGTAEIPASDGGTPHAELLCSVDLHCFRFRRGLLRERQYKKSVLELCANIAAIDETRQCERSGERAVCTF